MRIVVVSDTHGDFFALQNVLVRNSTADLIIHLGDGESELRRYMNLHPDIENKVIHIKGNCDNDCKSPEFLVIPVLNHRIFATHGHLYGVNASTTRLKMLAKENECDIVLYGHTHSGYQGFEDDLYLLNPGSASCPRDGGTTTFGHIDLSDAGVVLNIAPVPDLLQDMRKK